MDTEGSRTRRLPLALAAVLALAGAAYAPTLANGFTWDDDYVLVNNAAVRDLGNVPRFFVDAGSTVAPGGPATWRPLRAFVYALEHASWGLAPLGYHAVNLLLHLLATALVWALARRILGDERLPIVVAAAFAVHPLGTEAVASVAGLGDVMSAAFLLGALRIHLDLSDLRRAEWPRAAGVLALFAGALLSKETALAFPALVLWRELTLAPRPWRPSAARVTYLGLLAVLAGAFLVFRTAVLGSLGSGGSWEGITLGRTLWMQADVLARYLRMAVFPAGLSARHSVPVPISFFEPRTLFSVAAIAAVVGVAVAAWRRAPIVTFGIGWFFVGLLPVMNVIPIPGAVMGERFCYVPMIGLFLALAEGLRRGVARREWLRRPLAATAGAALVALAGASFVRCQDWRDNVTLFEAALRVAPDSNAVRINLVRAYQLRGELEKAQRQLEAAKANTHAHAGHYAAIGEAAEASGSREEAVAWYRRALSLVPGEPRALGGLARLGR